MLNKEPPRSDHGIATQGEHNAKKWLLETHKPPTKDMIALVFDRNVTQIEQSGTQMIMDNILMSSNLTRCSKLDRSPRLQ